MEDNAREEIIKNKRSSVKVKEVDVDDASIQTISISPSLVEILIEDPVCGRSDYSDLPGVRRGICSSWRSFSEFPRRTNFSRYQADTSVNLEQRRQKNYEAKIRREKLSLQRQAKREHLKAQQRERRRQQTFLCQLQGQSSSKCDSRNPGVIITSPQKGSPKKISKRDQSEVGNGNRKIKYGGNNKTSHGDVDVLQKSPGDCKDKVDCDVTNFDEGDGNNGNPGRYFDDVVSTTSAHYGDDGSSKNSKTFLKSTVSSASQAKNIFDSFKDSEDNPVTSSSQETPETSLKPVTPDTSRPSVNATCIVTSTTTPEIAIADSSTMSAPRRKTRNVKRVDYTEMLEDDSDLDLNHHSFRESINSGRKIRPVKRTLVEEAIVDASLKKIPRKRNSDVDKKESKGSSQPHSALLSNRDAEDEKIKQICDTIKQMTDAAEQLSASSAHVAGKKTTARSKHKKKKCGARSVAVDIPSQSLPVSTSEVFQPHSLCLSNASDVPLSEHSAFVSESLSNKQQNVSNQLVSSMSPSTPIVLPLVFSYQQPPYSAPLGHTATMSLSSVIPSHRENNSTIPAFSTFLQSPFQKSSPLVNAQTAVRYPVHSLTASGAGMQIHTSQTLLAGVPSFHKDTVVYDMNHSIQPPDLVLEPRTFIAATNKAAGSTSTYQPLIRQETGAGMQLNDHISKTSVVYHSPSATLLDSAVSADQQQFFRVQSMMTKNSLGQFVTPRKYITSTSPPTTTNKITSRDGTEGLSCKQQSQFNVESMLNSIHKSNLAEKNCDNSMELSGNKMLSSEIRCNQDQKNSESDHTVRPVQNAVLAPRFTSERPGLISKLAEVENQPQYVTFSPSQSPSQKGHSPSGQRAFLQPSNQSLQKNHCIPVGPPPLISVSDLLNSSVSVSSFGVNHGTSASPTYQNICSLTAPRTIHSVYSRGALPPASHSVLEKSSATSDMAAQIENLMQRAVMTAKPSSTAYFRADFLPQRSMQSQLSHSALQCPDAFLLSSKMKPVQPFSGSQPGQQLRMPALINCINNPRPADGAKKGRQTNRTPDKTVTLSTMTQQNLSLEQRVTAGMTIGQKPQVFISQASGHTPDECVSNFVVVNRYPPPMYANKPFGIQQSNTHKTMMASPRVAAPNSEQVTIRVAQPPEHWQPPLRQEPGQSRKRNSTKGKQSQDKVLQKTNLVDCSKPANQQGAQSGTLQQSSWYLPKSFDGAKLQNANLEKSHPFSVTEDRRTVERISTMMAANISQSCSMTLPNRVSDPAGKNTNLTSSLQHTVYTDKSVVTTLQQLPHEVHSGSPMNTVMCALDLSQKTSDRGQELGTLIATSSANPSVTVTSRLPHQKPVTKVLTSSASYSVTEISRLLQHTASVSPSVTVTSRLSHQRPITVVVSSSNNSSATPLSRLPQRNPETLGVTPHVNSSVTLISKLPYEKPVTSPTTSSVYPHVTTKSHLPQDHSTTSNEVPEMSCDYPLTRSQIKQESVSQPGQSENDTRYSLQPELNRSHMSAGDTVASSHMIVGRPIAVASSLPSLVSSQNSQPEHSNTWVSQSGEDSFKTVSASQMPLPTLLNNPRKESVGELIRVKVEAHLNHGNDSELAALTQSAATAASSVPLPDTALFTRAPLIPVSVSVTSSTAESQLSNQLGISRPGGVQSQTNKTPATLCHASSQQSVPSHITVAMQDILPAHLRIKQEIHTEAAENLEPVSSSNMPRTLHSVMPASIASVTQNNNTSDSGVNKSLAVSSDSVSALTAALSESLPLQQPGQSSTRIVESVLSTVVHNFNQHPLTSAESEFSSVKPSPNSQPLVPENALHASCVSGSVNSASGILTNLPGQSQNPTLYTVIRVEKSSTAGSSLCFKTENSSANSSIPECLADVSQTVIPVCGSVITTEAAMSKAGQIPSSLVSNSCGNHPLGAPAKTQIAVVLPPLLSTTSPNKQSIIKASNLNSVLNDPLFAWHTDSNKQVSSFSLEDITNPLPQEYEQSLPGLCSDFSVNNPYTVAAFDPCTENSYLPYYDTKALSVDTSVVKDEPSVDPVLDRREVIDLCLSDSEENDVLDTEASSCSQTACTENRDLQYHDAEASSLDRKVVKVEPSANPVLDRREVIDLCLSDSEDEENNLPENEASSCLQTNCTNYVCSISDLTCSTLENVKAVQTAADNRDQHFSKDNLQEMHTEACSVPMISVEHNTMPSKSIPKSNAGNSGISQFSPKQIIRSPLTGQNVSVSGEHVTVIRKRLARISTDLVLVNSDVPESETSPISASNPSNTPPVKVTKRPLFDSVTQASELEQSLLHTAAAGIEVHLPTSQLADTSASTSKNQVQKELFNTIEVTTKRASSTRRQTSGVKVKQENIETISIDDSSDDGSQQGHPSKSSEVNSSEVCCSSATFFDTQSSIFSMPFDSHSSVLSPQKDLSSLSGSESSVLSPSHGGSSRLASIANWTKEEVSEWLRNHKLEKVCPNLMSLNGPGLQRMAFEHWRDPAKFYSHIKKTLGLTFFHTMVICLSMKELNDSGLDE